ncbi:MAG: ATP-binding protein [Bacteroidota bacterium]
MSELIMQLKKQIAGHEKEMALLKESIAKFQLLIETMPNGFYRSTPDGYYVEVNEAMVKMLGYDSKEELMKVYIPTGIYVNPEERDEFERSNEDFVSNLEVYRLKTKDGRIIWLEDNARYIKDQNGKVIYNEGICRDITGRKRAEAEIKHQNEKLLKINTEKDKFFSIIAHDLRSPFNSFLGLTQIMAEDLPGLTMDEIQKFAVSMRNSAANLFRLLENLLQWATMQQGLIPVKKEVVKLLSVIDESIEMMLEPAKNKNIEIKKNIPGSLEVFADSNILQTVIRNLISNAVKFTDKGGTITISAKTTLENNVEIAIKDSGIGMNGTLIENLFRLDVQTSRQGTDGEPSTGLGLILCKDFIEKHGGKIWVESEKGKGSVFYFTIPGSTWKKEDFVRKNFTPDAPDINPGGHLKILIAEDDPTSGIFLARVVKIFSKQIIRTNTGKGAVETCRLNPDIDLVLMDIRMPEMDGLEATRRIRKFNKTVIIIAQTAYTLTDDRHKAIDAGCNDYISKPIKKDELALLIAKYFK